MLEAKDMLLGEAPQLALLGEELDDTGREQEQTRDSVHCDPVYTQHKPETT